MLNKKDYRTPSLTVAVLDAKDDVLANSNEMVLDTGSVVDVEVDWKG